MNMSSLRLTAVVVVLGLAVTVVHGLDGNGSYGDARFGSSYIMAVELTPTGPPARTILTYSESSNPDSPHYNDQTVLYSQKRWATERFTETESTPTRSYRPPPCETEPTVRSKTTAVHDL
jgi:acyl-homoserine lactone acylase PvdQ